MRQYGFPGHSVAASPLVSLWNQAQAAPPRPGLRPLRLGGVANSVQVRALPALLRVGKA
jgi:hypothetical protein